MTAGARQPARRRAHGAPVSREPPAASAPDGENRRIAELLRQSADVLAEQGANPFRVNAYRRAADTVAALGEPVRARFDEGGREGLRALAGIGEGIASTIAEILITGRSSRLERLRGTTDVQGAFRAVPGIGRELAARIHDTLHIDTLEALEAACADGSLAQVPGIGSRRAQAISAALTSMLDKRRAIRRARTRVEPAREPRVAVLLEIDRDYRDKARRGMLPTITPRRFNPRGESWLPVLHASRAGFHFTALFSNTARAHELGKTRDWVVVYFYDDRHAEGQRTVVTEARGALIGRRVVRGREPECRAFYAGESRR